MVIDDKHLKSEQSLALWERRAGPSDTAMPRAEMQACALLLGIGAPPGRQGGRLAPLAPSSFTAPSGESQQSHFRSTKGETQGQGGKVPS